AYRAELWLNDAPLHGPGIAIELRARGATRGGARLSGFFVAPSEVRRELAGASFVGGAIALDALLDVSISRDVSLSAALGVAIELSHAVPLAGNDVTLALEAPFGTTTTLGRALLGVLVHPDPALSVRVDLTFAIDLGDTRFSVQSPGGPREAFDPWLLRPGLQLVVLFEALGGSGR
ncbi:MAG: hypothetical protein M3Y87_00610, partial [Myxococcota bacterium]|nr:hypothetical protein [Myxococcota bacterium]